MPEPERNTRFVVTATAALVLLLSVVARAQSPTVSPLDPQSYAAELRRLADTVRATEAGAIARLQREIPPAWRVDVGGRPVDVSTAWLQRQLHRGALVPAEWPAIRATLLEQLTAAQAEARALDSAAPDSKAAKAVLQDVLSRPEFSGIGREDAWAAVQERIFDWFRRVWTRLGGDRVAVRSTAELFAWIASLTAVGVLAAWVIHILRRSARATSPVAYTAADSLTSAAAWAQRAASASDLREAVRCAYRAAVRRGEEEGAWRADDSRTPREYVHLLPRDHRRRSPVEEIARRFEEVFFAGRAATDDDRGAVTRRLRELGCLAGE